MEGVVVCLCGAQHLFDGLLFGQRRNWERQLRKVATAQTAAPVHRSAGADLEDVLVEPGIEYGKGVVGIHLLGGETKNRVDRTDDADVGPVLKPAGAYLKLFDVDAEFAEPVLIAVPTI